MPTNRFRARLNKQRGVEMAHAMSEVCDRCNAALECSQIGFCGDCQPPIYSAWEEAVTQQVADDLCTGYSEAAGVVEGQDVDLQQSWTKGLSAQQAAQKIIAAVTNPTEQ